MLPRGAARRMPAVWANRGTALSPRAAHGCFHSWPAVAVVVSALAGGCSPEPTIDELRSFQRAGRFAETIAPLRERLDETPDDPETAAGPIDRVEHSTPKPDGLADPAAVTDERDDGRLVSKVAVPAPLAVRVVAVRLDGGSLRTQHGRMSFRGLCPGWAQARSRC